MFKQIFVLFDQLLDRVQVGGAQAAHSVEAEHHESLSALGVGVHLQCGALQACATDRACCV